MIKVIIYALTATNGGVENFLLNFWRRIDYSKFHFDFISIEDNSVFTNEILKSNSKIYYIPMRKSGIIRHEKAINDFFKEHGHEYDAVWFCANTLSDISFIKAAYHYKIPVRICHSHNTGNISSHPFSAFFHRLNKNKISRYATDFWACSKKAAEWLYPSKILKANAVVLIHNAIEANKFAFNPNDRDRMRKSLGLEGRFVVGHVGRFSLQKNHDFLLDIFSEIYKKNTKAVLLLIGTGELLNSVQVKVKKLHLEKAVRFLGSRQDVAFIMQAMDVFLFPSQFEGLPVVLIEAQAAGLPSYTSAGVVTQEAKITDLLHYISLDKSATYWAERVLKSRAIVRRNTYSIIVAKSYNVESEACKLQKLLAKYKCL